MLIEVEDVFGTRKAMINGKRIMEINRKKRYVQTVDGEKYDVALTVIDSLLKAMESR